MISRLNDLIADILADALSTSPNRWVKEIGYQSGLDGMRDKADGVLVEAFCM